jgi:hypothetical protein
MEVEIKINGLPVTVDVTMAPAEPDVGIMGAYVDDYRIVAIGSSICAKWPRKRNRRCRTITTITGSNPTGRVTTNCDPTNG